MCMSGNCINKKRPSKNTILRVFARTISDRGSTELPAYAGTSLFQISPYGMAVPSAIGSRHNL